MVPSVEMLDNKLNFMYSIIEELSRKVDMNLDFYSFIMDKNLTSTDAVLIIKGLTIMNYRLLGSLNEHIEEFEGDEILNTLLLDEQPNIEDFKKFIEEIREDLDVYEVLNKLKNQNIGRNICEILLEDKVNN